MTTSEPRTPHDDTPREHRRLGQRILDAVLGDPADTQRDDLADPRRDDLADPRPGGTERADGRTGVAGFAGDGPRGDYASYEQATRDRADGGVGQDDRAATQGYAAPAPNPGGMPTDALPDAGDTVSDARRDAGQSEYVDRSDALRDAGYDARRDAGQAGYAGTAPDAAHDLPRPGTGTAGDDRDLVTSSYDPDRDAGYDPQAAGTAVRDYDPAQDTGYVDAGRAEADRTTGRQADDLDTGRVDIDRTDIDREPVDQVPTEPVDRDDTHRGVGAVAGAAGAGAVAAAAFRGDPDRDTDRDADRDTRFSAVDDSATVAGSDTGPSTAETAAAGVGRGDAGVADEDGSSDTRERLVPAERAEDYSSRWDALKGDFVDEPRRAVRQADELVGELLDELQRLFSDQRRNLEQGFDHDQASTEDLRLALRRYRSFFDRLLSF
jgi:hypothetical protein